MNLKSKDIYYVGVNDHIVDLFEGHYHVKNGMAYNSYVIKDEQIAVMDTVDQHFGDEWLKNLKSVLGEAKPSYLIVQHMEPDHSANIMNFVHAYPEATVVFNEQSYTMFKQYFHTELANKKIVNDGESLSLGKHLLTFVFAPMVHWPEVMVTYDSYVKCLFSADAFGKFGALDVKEDWLDEARRYYIGIVGKFGMLVQILLRKASALDIQAIYPLHGPVLEENLSYYLGKYLTWSGYQPETDGVAIFYTSVYGHTKEAVELLAKELKAAGNKKVVVYDLARSDMEECVARAFEYKTIVLASTTYNTKVFPYMRIFLHELNERNFQNRTIAFVENGTWAPNAIKTMKGILSFSKDLTFIEPEITILSSLDEKNKEDIRSLAARLMN